MPGRRPLATAAQCDARLRLRSAAFALEVTEKCIERSSVGERRVNKGVERARHMDNIPDVIKDSHPRGKGREVSVNAEPDINEHFERVIDLAATCALHGAWHHRVARDDSRFFKPAHTCGRRVWRQAHRGP